MQTRFSFGGDEHIFAEVDDAMSLEAFFKSLFITNAVRDAKIKGVAEICPANASYQVKFDPDRIKPDDLLTELKRMDTAAEKSEPVIATRIIEIPVLYNDPWTHETLMRFRERHQDPNGTDLEYAARINNLDGVDSFIKAHSSAPWFVSMVGFVVGRPSVNPGESANCYLTGAPNNDFEFTIAAAADATPYEGIVGEMIPQNRPKTWTLGRLKKLETDRRQVMVVGQLMFDTRHLPNPKRGTNHESPRVSTWEIHPVTTFLVCQQPGGACDPRRDEQWQPLESMVER